MDYTILCPRMHEPPLPPLGETESKKIGFVAPIISSAEISKTIKMHMVSKHGITNVIIR